MGQKRFTDLCAVIKYSRSKSPFLKDLGGSTMYRIAEQTAVFIDLGAEKLIAAEKQGQKIAVEIKSFVGLSEVANLEQALIK